MWRIVSWLSSLAGALSIVLLLHEAYQIGFSFPLELIINYYKSIANYVFGWLDPYMVHVAEYLQTLFNIELKIYSHWKHFLVPMLLLVGSSVKATWTMNSERSFERKASAIAILLYGSLISLVASALSGTIDVNSSSLMPVIIPMLGLIVMNITTILWDAILKTKSHRTRKQILSYYFIWDILPSLAAALLCIGFGYWSETILGRNNSILAFVLYISFLSIRSLVAGRIEEACHIQEEEIVSDSTKYESASTRVGLLLARSIGATIIFLALNSGLQLAGIDV